jgi:pimeloyl-ACP methyl ester carboxylesterase
MIPQPWMRASISYHTVRHKSSHARGKAKPASINTERTALNINHATLNAKPTTVNVKLAALKSKPTAVNAKPAVFDTKPAALNAKRRPAPVPYRPPPTPVVSAPRRTIVDPEEIVNFDSEGRLTVYDSEMNRIASKSDPGVGLVYVQQPGDTEFFRLSDGRTLCYASYGRRASKGPVLLFFHGTPGSRIVYSHWHKWAEGKGFRAIAIDRPGYGHSTARSGDVVLDFASDVEELVNWLDIREFMVLGTSGGGPYALACAYHFTRSRLLATGIMCGAGGVAPGWAVPRVAIAYFCGIWLPRSLNNLYWQDRFTKERISRKNNAKTGLQESVDLLLQFEERHRQLAVGYSADKSKLNDRTKWGFDFNEIDSNPIHWYHGIWDHNCPYHGVKWICDRIRKDIIHLKAFKGENHFTVQDHALELYEKVVEESKKARPRR